MIDAVGIQRSRRISDQKYGCCPQKKRRIADYSRSTIVYMPGDSLAMAGIRDTALIEAFAKVLRDARKKKGLTQEALALSAGVDRTFIGLLEAAKRQPTLSVICAIALATDQKAGQLVDRSLRIAEEARRQDR